MLTPLPRSALTEELLHEAFASCLQRYGCAHIPAALELAGEISTERAVDREKRAVSGTANALSISRSMIRVSIEGLDVRHFNQNPVALANHMHINMMGSPLVIARIERVMKVNNNQALRFIRMTFDDDPIADQWFQKISKGFVRMVSIGFLPHEWEVATEVVGRGENKREIHFIDISRSELLEISPVAIGANRGAFIDQWQPSDQLMQRLAKVDAAIKRLQGALDAWAKNKTEASEHSIARLESAIARFAELRSIE